MKKMNHTMKTQSQTEIWEQIRQFYHDKFGIEPNLVDLMSDFDILKLCVTGSSTLHIAEFLDYYSVEYVKDIINKHFGFTGWETDLLVSPLRLYNAREAEFLDEKTKSICEIFSVLERLLDEKWI